MKSWNFYKLMVISVIAVECFIYYISKSCESKGGFNRPEAVHSRLAQGSADDLTIKEQNIPSWERGISIEPFFPIESEYNGKRWNDVFKENEESYSSFIQAYRQNSAIRSIRLITIGSDSLTKAMIGNQVAEFLRIAFSSKVTVQKTIGGYFENGEKLNADHILSSLMQNPWIHRISNLNVIILSKDIYVPGLNYLFGYADYVNHICVVSTYRLSSPSRGLYLRRLMKVIRHEIGHMYGLVHCNSPQCVMRGINSVSELDATTVSMCNGCASKIAWRLGDDGTRRGIELMNFYNKIFKQFFRFE